MKKALRRPLGGAIAQGPSGHAGGALHCAWARQKARPLGAGLLPHVLRERNFSRRARRPGKMIWRLFSGAFTGDSRVPLHYRQPKGRKEKPRISWSGLRFYNPPVCARFGILCVLGNLRSVCHCLVVRTRGLDLPARAEREALPPSRFALAPEGGRSP